MIASRKLAVLVIALVMTEAGSATSSDTQVACESLATVSFAGLTDAPTQIIEAGLLREPELPEVCKVTGYVLPQIGFAALLPTTAWNGKFIEQGCGGFCGSSQTGDCHDSLKKGYACISSDTGHASRFTQALWAYNNLQAQIDHAYRGAHVVSLAGKAILGEFYKRSPSRSYFVGCSTGGRQALMEAQRFPWDFDGIIAGSPSLRVTTSFMALVWASRALTDADGSSLFSKADLLLLETTVHRACDAKDGLVDGIVEDPLTCNFNLEALQCRSQKTDQCLTAKQIEGARKMYSGPMTSKGEKVFPLARAMPGSERAWVRIPVGSNEFISDMFRYVAFSPAPGAAWNANSFDFDVDYKRLGEAQGLMDATNPDLRTFKAAGGKLIIYTGWNDVAGLPLPAIDYYETVERVMGGRAAAQDFVRLFAVPGMGHCAEGAGAWSVDYLSYLEEWVEEGRAPDKLIGVHPDAGADGAVSVKFSRPIFPYPMKAKYIGRGDPNSASTYREASK